MRNIIIALLFSAQAFAQSFDFRCPVLIDGEEYYVEDTFIANPQYRYSYLDSGVDGHFSDLFGVETGYDVPEGWILRAYGVDYVFSEYGSYLASSGSEIILHFRIEKGNRTDPVEFLILKKKDD